MVADMRAVMGPKYWRESPKRKEVRKSKEKV